MKRLCATLLVTVLSFAPVLAKAGQIEALPSESAGQCLPPAVVASFLGFTETQAAQFGDLLALFQATLHGLQEQIAARQAQLSVLLDQPNPDPAIVGSLFLQIHTLERQVAQVIQGFQSQFTSLLTDEQRQKVQAVTQVSLLQSVVGAFVALYLAPAPTPLPCRKQ